MGAGWGNIQGSETEEAEEEEDVSCERGRCLLLLQLFHWGQSGEGVGGSVRGGGGAATSSSSSLQGAGEEMSQKKKKRKSEASPPPTRPPPPPHSDPPASLPTGCSTHPTPSTMTGGVQSQSVSVLGGGRKSLSARGRERAASPDRKQMREGREGAGERESRRVRERE